MTDHPYHVLVLCTGNSARSIMTEALLNTMGKGRFRVYSAGSHPTGQINPFALDKVRSINYPAEQLRSKGWDEFAGPDAPRMDFVITVCDNAARETCPAWPGQPITAHWGFADPAAVQGTDEQKRQAFDACFRQIMNRVRIFIELPFSTLDRSAIREEVRHIGEAPLAA